MSYDILVLGATGMKTKTTTILVTEEGTIAPGFTGKYIAEYLNSHPQRSGSTPFTFAIAGRSQKKLEELKRELKLGDEVGVLVVNVGDYASVEAAVTKTKVMINVVGPFWKYADNVVR